MDDCARAPSPSDVKPGDGYDIPAGVQFRTRFSPRAAVGRAVVAYPKQRLIGSVAQWLFREFGSL